MTHPYRSAEPKGEALPPRGRSLWGRLRSLARRLLIARQGTFRSRFPATCPCGLRSWDPEAVRRGSPALMNASVFRMRANSWRCGKRHDLVGSVRLG